LNKNNNAQAEENLGNEEDLMENDIDHRDNLNLDDLEKNSIDIRRIKKIDYTKKKATVDSVFDERMYFLVNQLLKNRKLRKIEGIISAGKEANVYLAYNDIDEEVAVKIYKIDNNTSKWMKNYIIGDPRYKKIPHNISKIIFLWASKEFKNLKRAYSAGLRVPKPIYVKDNILIMEYIGFKSTPAPRLKDVKKLEDPEGIFNEIKFFMKNLYQIAKLVHADLSEFNILFHNQKPVIIDISQAVTKEHPKAEVYLARDIKNIFNYFERLGLTIPDPEDFYYEIINVKKSSSKL
jgi:RIO kinase 1